MSNRPITAQTWADYSITAAIADDAQKINLGLISFDGATAWWDNVRVEVSRPASRPATEANVKNLVAFARLAGYVRHYHPSDAAASADWPRLIAAAIPKVEKAPDSAALAAELQAVFAPIAPTVRVFETGKEPALPAELSPPENAGALKVRYWEHLGYQQDDAVKMEDVYSSERKSIDVNALSDLPAYARPADVYRSDLGAGVSCFVPTALFADEKGTLPHTAESAAANLAEADLREQRLAAVIIAWNILEHFYPYFDVVRVDWLKELEVALKAAATDVDDSDFYQTLHGMIVALQDGHGRLSGPGMPIPTFLPLRVELIEGRVVVVAVSPDVNGIKPGDIIERIDGTAALDEFRKTASRQTAATPQDRNYNGALFFGCEARSNQVVLEVRGGDGQVGTVSVTRSSQPVDSNKGRPPQVDEIRPGVFYLDLTRLTDDQFNEAMPRLEQAKGLIFDMRGYPKGNSPAWIQHLSSQALESAWWNIPRTHRPEHSDVEWDDSQRWTLPPLQPLLTPNRVFLTNGSAISRAETLMGIVEAYKLGEIVGEATAGTNGNMCWVDVSLGYRMTFTGMKVLKHDRSRHHGVGIAPTVPVAKTIRAVREGRDEQLERALSLLK
jgi:C-terminal processing protease CtpA/Prc